MCLKGSTQSVTWVQLVVLGHLGAHMDLAARFGQLHLPLALGQFLFLLRGALVVAVGAAHAFDVMRGLFVLLPQGPSRW